MEQHRRRAFPVGTEWKLGGRNVHTMVFQTGRPARIDDYASASGPVADVAREWGSARRSACRSASRAGCGASWSWHPAREPLPAGTEARLAGFTELAATAIANAEAQAALTASRARIVATADATRRRIERNLHDGAQQRLVSLALDLRAAQAAAPPGAGELVQQLDGVAAGLDDVLEELREIARGLHPAILAEGGLRPALKTLARRSAVPVHLDIQVTGRLPEPVEIAAYYTVAEALTNAAKHAHATAAEVEVAAAAASCTFASATTAAAARTSATAPAWSGSRTGPRRSAATSGCTARPAQAPPWRSPCPSTTPSGYGTDTSGPSGSASALPDPTTRHTPGRSSSDRSRISDAVTSGHNVPLDQSTWARFASCRFASRRSALVRSALVRSAPTRFAP